MLNKKEYLNLLVLFERDCKKFKFKNKLLKLSKRAKY